MIIHLRAKNFASSCLIIGVTILNIQNLINAVIWHSPDSISPLVWHSRESISGWHGQILCDIEVKLYVGIFQAVDGAIASIFRQIALILHPDRIGVAPSPRQRKISWFIELTLCVFLPIYVMIGHYMISRSRYWLRTSTGCVPTFDSNYVTPFVTFLWPVVSSLVGCAYCLVAIVRLCKHRRQMSAALAGTPGVTTSRLYRIFGFASALLAIYCPLSILAFANNERIARHKFSWSFIHPPDWSERIFALSNSVLGDQNISFDRWGQVATAYVSFAFFGLGQDAARMYKTWMEHVTRGFRSKNVQSG